MERKNCSLFTAENAKSTVNLWLQS